VTFFQLSRRLPLAENIVHYNTRSTVQYPIKWYQNGADIQVPVIWTVLVFKSAQNLLPSYVLLSWTAWYNWTVELIMHNVTNTYGGLLWQNLCLLRVTYSHVIEAEQPDRQTDRQTCCLHGELKVNTLVFF